jgi:hypothetical protein
MVEQAAQDHERAQLAASVPSFDELADAEAAATRARVTAELNEHHPEYLAMSARADEASRKVDELTLGRQAASSSLPGSLPPGPSLQAQAAGPGVEVEVEASRARAAPKPNREQPRPAPTLNDLRVDLATAKVELSQAQATAELYARDPQYAVKSQRAHEARREVYQLQGAIKSMETADHAVAGARSGPRALLKMLGARFVFRRSRLDARDARIAPLNMFYAMSSAMLQKVVQFLAPGEANRFAQAGSHEARAAVLGSPQTWEAPDPEMAKQNAYLKYLRSVPDAERAKNPGIWQKHDERMLEVIQETFRARELNAACEHAMEEIQAAGGIGAGADSDGEHQLDSGVHKLEKSVKTLTNLRQKLVEIRHGVSVPFVIEMPDMIRPRNALAQTVDAILDRRMRDMNLIG